MWRTHSPFRERPWTQQSHTTNSIRKRLTLASPRTALRKWRRFTSTRMFPCGWRVSLLIAGTMSRRPMRRDAKVRLMLDSCCLPLNGAGRCSPIIAITTVCSTMHGWCGRTSGDTCSVTQVFLSCPRSSLLCGDGSPTRGRSRDRTRYRPLHMDAGDWVEAMASLRQAVTSWTDALKARIPIKVSPRRGFPV